MTQELLSTSVPAGLQPGRSGFCTVAMTQGMPRPLVELLESLSAYRPAFMPSDPRASDNPIATSHLRMAISGKTYCVLSRVCFAGLDYTNRTNRFAHHVVLDNTDPRPELGPAALASRSGFLQDHFDGQIRYLPGGKSVPDPVDAVSVDRLDCPTWMRLARDAGWAGVLAEAMVNPAGRPVFLLYDPGTDVLALIREAMALLPPPRRWEVTFTTYFTGLPATISCLVRGVLRGSPEALAAPPGVTLDLAKLATTPAPPGEWTQAARTGRVVWTAARTPTTPLPAVARPGQPPSPAQLARLAEEARSATKESAIADTPVLSREPRGVGRGVLLTLLASVVVLIGGAGAIYAVRPDLFSRPEVSPVSIDLPVTQPPRDKTGEANKITPKAIRILLHPPDPPVGADATLHVEMEFAEGKIAFPWEKVTFSLADKPLPAATNGDGTFAVTFDRPIRASLLVRYPGDERFEGFSRSLEVNIRQTPPLFRIARALGIGSAKNRAIQVTGLPRELLQGEKLQVVDAKGRSFDLVALSDSNTLVVQGLPPGKHLLHGRFLGDDAFAPANSANTVEVGVQRQVTLQVKPPDRVRLSEGKLNLLIAATSSKGEPPPRGEVQLLSRNQVHGKARLVNGQVELRHDSFPVGYHQFLVRYLPENDIWESAEYQIPGVWAVVPTVDLDISLAEKVRNSKERVEFSRPELPEQMLRELPHLAGRYASALAPLSAIGNPYSGMMTSVALSEFRHPRSGYWLEFRPSRQRITGKLLPIVEPSETGTVKLVVRWQPTRNSWPNEVGPVNVLFQVMTFLVAEPDNDRLGSVKFVLTPKFPLKIGYVPLVPSYREAVRSFHNAVIEVYEARIQEVPRKGMEPRKVRTRGSELPLVRIKLIDR